MKKISTSNLLNIILVSVLIVAGIFGYLYYKQLNPVEVIKANAPQVSLPEYEFAFAFYGGEKDFDNPHEVLVIDNSIYVSDYNNKRIGVYDLNGRHQKDITSKEMVSPAGMFWDGSKLYVADTESYQIFVMDPEGAIIDRIKLQKSVLAADVAVDKDFLYILNNNAMTVEKYDLKTKKTVRKFAGYGKEAGKLYYPYSITVRNGNVYVADSMNNRINVYDLEGKFVQKLPKAKDGKDVNLAVPRGLAFDRGGRLYTAEGVGYRVAALNEDGDIALKISESQPLKDDQVQEITLPTDVTFDGLGRMYVLEHSFKRVLVYRVK